MSQPLCPICRRPAEPVFRPFCSKRCADIDLQRWFSGGYVIGGGEEEGGAAPPKTEDEAE